MKVHLLNRNVIHFIEDVMSTRRWVLDGAETARECVAQNQRPDQIAVHEDRL